MDLASLNKPLVQVGFLSADEIEDFYDIHGSALGQITSSLTQAVALGDDAASGPYLGVYVSRFDNDDTASELVGQLDQIMPGLANKSSVDDVKVEGASAVAAVAYSSPGSGTEEANSIRVVASVGNDLIVVDIQGAKDLGEARKTAVDFAEAQIGCQGGGSCETPEAAA